MIFNTTFALCDSKGETVLDFLLNMDQRSVC